MYESTIYYVGRRLHVYRDRPTTTTTMLRLADTFCRRQAGGRLMDSGYRAGNHRFAGNDRLVEISRPMFSRLTEIGRP